MPRGIPKSGTRLPGSGRKKTYASDLTQKWVPLTVASHLDNVYQLLGKLEREIAKWESLCEVRSTSPRYEQARKLTNTIRAMLNELGFSPHNIYANNQQDYKKENNHDC
jgi:hypothetical protein